MLAPTITDPRDHVSQEAAHQFVLETFTGGEQFYANVKRLVSEHDWHAAVWQLIRTTRRKVSEHELRIWTALALRAKRELASEAVTCN